MAGLRLPLEGPGFEWYSSISWTRWSLISPSADLSLPRALRLMHRFNYVLRSVIDHRSSSRHRGLDERYTYARAEEAREVCTHQMTRGLGQQEEWEPLYPQQEVSMLNHVSRVSMDTTSIESVLDKEPKDSHVTRSGRSFISRDQQGEIRTSSTRMLSEASNVSPLL